MRERRTLASMAILLCFMLVSISVALGSGMAGPDTSEVGLIKLVMQNEDPRITEYDLAFFLATHSYDSTPMDGYVRVQIDGCIYDLIPNGDLPGLADLVSV